MVAAALIGGSIGSAVIGGISSNKAASTQAAAANNATAVQADTAQVAMANANANNAPYKQAGSTALSQIGGLLNLPGYASVDPSSYLKSLPGYQFQLQQGEQAINNQGSAGSGAINSATMAGLNNYAQGQAQSSYGNYISQLGGLATMGQASANNSTAATTNILGNLGNQVGSNTLAAGNASAAGTMGISNALSNGISGATGGYTLGNLLGNGAGGYQGGSGGTSVNPNNTDAMGNSLSMYGTNGSAAGVTPSL